MNNSKYLNINKLRERLPKLWDYKFEDKNTWPYIDCMIAGKENGKVYVSKWIKNPKFKYWNRIKENK